MQNKEIQTLLNTISTALKTNSVDEVNHYINSAAKMKKGGEYALRLHILQLVGMKYELSIAAILNTKSNRKIVYARKVCYCLMHNVLKYKARYIASDVFKMKYHNTVSVAIQKYKQCNEKIKLDREFKKDIDELTEKALQYKIII
jgi:chromosomal replication initiation ATPase DnaA